MVHYEPPHQDLCCLQILLFSFLDHCICYFQALTIKRYMCKTNVLSRLHEFTDRSGSQLFPNTLRNLFACQTLYWDLCYNIKLHLLQSIPLKVCTNLSIWKHDHFFKGVWLYYHTLSHTTILWLHFLVKATNSDHQL